MRKLASTLRTIIILMAQNQGFTIIKQVLSPSPLTPCIKMELPPAVHLVKLCNGDQ